MMVFFKEIISIDGEHHPMWNVLDGTVYMQKNLGGLGAQSLSFEDGLIRGHAFHYSVCRTVIPVQQYALKKVGGVSGEAMYAFGSVRASYFHAWFPSNMTASARLFLPHGEGSLNEG
jgi:cobyrinic acid a,c-diamide synthase